MVKTIEVQRHIVVVDQVFSMKKLCAKLIQKLFVINVSKQ